MLAALAAVTERLGLAGTINSTFNEPYEVARQFAILDHLSGGRAAWNVVTSWDAFTGENFRRGGFLPQPERYARAEEFLQTARELLDSWCGDEIVADKEPGVSSDPAPGRSSTTVRHFDIRGQFNVPRTPGSTCHLPGRRLGRRAASSRRPPPTPSSAGTAPSTRARPSTPTSKAGWPVTARARLSF